MTLLPRFVTHTYYELTKIVFFRNSRLPNKSFSCQHWGFFPGQVVGFSKRFHFYGKEQSGVHFTAQWLFGVKRCLLQNLNPQDDYS